MRKNSFRHYYFLFLLILNAVLAVLILFPGVVANNPLSSKNSNTTQLIIIVLLAFLLFGVSLLYFAINKLKESTSVEKGETPTKENWWSDLKRKRMCYWIMTMMV
jgi:uncharacterized membrane protein YjgN (DUF898 family)